MRHQCGHSSTTVQSLFSKTSNDLSAVNIHLVQLSNQLFFCQLTLLFFPLKLWCVEKVKTFKGRIWIFIMDTIILNFSQKFICFCPFHVGKNVPVTVPVISM